MTKIMIINMEIVVICPNYDHNNSYEYENGGDYHYHNNMDYYCYYNDDF